MSHKAFTILILAALIIVSSIIIGLDISLYRDRVRFGEERYNAGYAEAQKELVHEQDVEIVVEPNEPEYTAEELDEIYKDEPALGRLAKHLYGYDYMSEPNEPEETFYNQIVETIVCPKHGVSGTIRYHDGVKGHLYCKQCYGEHLDNYLVNYFKDND